MSARPAGGAGSGAARLRRLGSRYARPYWKGLLALVAANLVLAGLAAAPPFLIAATAETVLGDPAAPGAGPGFAPGGLSLRNLGAALLRWLGLDAGVGRFRVVLILMGLYGGVRILHALVSFGAYLLALRLRVRSARDLQVDLFAHLLSLPLGFFTRQRTGALVSRLENDTAGVTYGFEGIVGTLVTAPILIAFYGTLLLRTSPMLAAVAALAVALHFGISRSLRESLRRRVRDQFSALADLTAMLQESILGIRILKSFAAERWELGRLRRSVERVVRINLRYGAHKHVGEPIQGAANALIEVGIALVATHQVIAGTLTPAAALLFFYVGQRLVQPVTELGTAYLSVQALLAASERIFEILDTEPSVASGPERPAGFRHSLRVEGVSFAYEREPVLRDVNLEVRKGELVALVGPSGAGKSTLADLLLRFCDPSKGRICLDGSDVRRFVQEDYRRLFGVVPQEALLFNASVAENIAWGREGLSPAAIRAAAEIANAHDFIEQLPEGYGTQVGDRGIRLSGGQRQRIAIARAVVGAPEILILDEATSALDSESERQVQAAIDKVIHQSTALVIAHRLSTVAGADRIAVLERGRVLDSGRHEELLERCALYRRLCELQFGQAATARGG